MLYWPDAETTDVDHNSSALPGDNEPYRGPGYNEMTEDPLFQDGDEEDNQDDAKSTTKNEDLAYNADDEEQDMKTGITLEVENVKTDKSEPETPRGWDDLSPRMSEFGDGDRSAITNFTFDTRMIVGDYDRSGVGLKGREARAFKRELDRQKRQSKAFQNKLKQERKMLIAKQNRKKMLNRKPSVKKRTNKVVTAEQLQVGNAVVLKKRGLGIVRYIGPLHCDDQEVTWLGVELKKADGKNDGSVQNKKYFSCPPNHGVFVRQVKRKIDPGELLAKIAKLKKENDQIAGLKGELRQTKREFQEYKYKVENFEQRVLELSYPLLTQRGAGALVGQFEATGHITSEVVLHPQNSREDSIGKEGDSKMQTNV